MKVLFLYIIFIFYFFYSLHDLIKRVFLILKWSSKRFTLIFFHYIMLFLIKIIMIVRNKLIFWLKHLKCSVDFDNMEISPESSIDHQCRHPFSFDSTGSKMKRPISLKLGWFLFLKSCLKKHVEKIIAFVKSLGFEKHSTWEKKKNKWNVNGRAAWSASITFHISCL